MSTSGVAASESAGEENANAKPSPPPKQKDQEKKIVGGRAAKVVVKTETRLDGTKIETRQDKTTLQTDPDGTTVETFRDGRKLQKNTNGDTIENLPDGTVIKTDVLKGVSTVILPNGHTVVTFSDGATMETFRDGSTIQRKDGIVIEKRKNGTMKQIQADGSSIETFEDGTTIHISADRSRRIEHPDGRIVQRNANGTVIEVRADGTKIQTSVDGVRIEKFPDGRVIQTDATGTIVERLADGTLLAPRQPDITYTCVQCNVCGSIISVQNKAFVISCSMCSNIMLASQVQVIGTPNTLMVHTSDSSGVEIKADVKSVFDRYDVDKSGGVDESELTKMLKDLNFPVDQLQDLFKETDSNNDGQLQFAEFVVYFNKLQARILALAQAPNLMFGKSLIEEQQKLLEDTKLALQAKLREHDSISTPLDPEEISKAAESRRLIVEQIAEINKEQKQRETSLKATVHAYHEKRHTALQQKVEARRISMKQG
eukprot:g3625.t1